MKTKEKEEIKEENKKKCKCEDKSCKKEDLNELIKEKDKKIEELQNKLMVKEADFINFKRRKEEESLHLIKYASVDLILEILKSVDNLERAIIATSETDDNKGLLIGIKMVYQNLVNTLTSFGVKEIEASGIKFDHNVHNAVMTDNNPEIEDDIITEVLQKGYIYKEKVIRPAMVKVNKKEGI